MKWGLEQIMWPEIWVWNFWDPMKDLLSILEQNLNCNQGEKVSLYSKLRVLFLNI